MLGPGRARLEGAIEDVRGAGEVAELRAAIRFVEEVDGDRAHARREIRRPPRQPDDVPFVLRLEVMDEVAADDAERADDDGGLAGHFGFPPRCFVA